MIYKPEIRRKIREKRKQLSTRAIKSAAEKVAAQLIYLPKLIESKHLASYLPQENELDPGEFIHTELPQNKTFCLPVLSGDDTLLHFYSYDFSETLQKNKFGINEPLTENKKPADPLDLDIIFVPLVAFDENCNRIGRGAGYYDRTFASLDLSSKKRPLLIGLAYEFQKIKDTEPSDSDVPLDMVVTEDQIYRR